MSYDNLSSVSRNVLKFYHQLTGEERRIPFIFDDSLHFERKEAKYKNFKLRCTFTLEKI
jgi:hypothetical protein